MKIKIIFLSCELPLIFGVGEKLKITARDIYKITLDIEYERDQAIGLGSTIGDARSDSQTDRQIHTHTNTDTHTRTFSKTYF